jgi:hypothetical protein
MKTYQCHQSLSTKTYICRHIPDQAVDVKIAPTPVFRIDVPIFVPASLHKRFLKWKISQNFINVEIQTFVE